MPDFTYEFYYQCSSVTYFRTQVEKYDVTLSENGNRCECKGYQFSKGPEKHCKHITEAEKKRCGWLQFVHGGVPVARGGFPACPECGAEVDSRKWAV
jgi:hypothetical protein